MRTCDQEAAMRVEKVERAWAKHVCAENGQTLPAELISIALLALAVGIILVGISVGSAGVKVKHQRVSASNLAKSQLELIADAPYSADPTAVPYPTVEPVTGYSVVVAVEYWIAPTGPFTATVRDDNLQKITVTVTGSEGEIFHWENYKVDR